MKFITYILFYTFFMLTAGPATIMLASSLSRNCQMSCSSEEQESCELDMQCCGRTCNANQCCYCCFQCPVDTKQIEIRTFAVQLNKQGTDSFCALSGFTNDCWQPPEKI